MPGAATTSPAHCRPIVAMSRPMPAAIACFSDVGIAVISRSRRPMPAVSDEDDPGDRDGAERDRPRHLHAEHDRVREEEVVPHRRRDGDRVVRQQRHQQRGERGRRGTSRRARRRSPCPHALSTAGCTKMMYAIVRNVVSAGEDLGADGRAVGGEREALFEEPHVARDSTSQPPGGAGLEVATPRAASRAACCAGRRGSRGRR